MSPSKQKLMPPLGAEPAHQHHEREVAMLSERFNLGLKVFLGVLPICYAGMILATLPFTLQWLIVVGVILITLVVLVAWLDCPFRTIWPVFPGVILMTAGAIALMQDADLGGPVTSTPYELLIVFVPAMLYIIWGIRATWKAAAQVY
jgi:hypothetical protein